MYTTYILYSHKIDRSYTGSCQDISFRLTQHNTGRNKSTKHGMPWEIVYTINCNTRSEAVALETKIKKRGAKRFLHDIQNRIG